jgi:hypothetical protein
MEQNLRLEKNLLTNEKEPLKKTKLSQVLKTGPFSVAYNG